MVLLTALQTRRRAKSRLQVGLVVTKPWIAILSECPGVWWRQTHADLGSNRTHGLCKAAPDWHELLMSGAGVMQPQYVYSAPVPVG